MKIGNIDLDSEVLVVAEIGNNHEGKMAVARELVRKAADAGVQAVKFQTFRTEHYVSSAEPARFDRLKSFELSHAQFKELAELARSLGLLFISTPFDLASAQFLEGIVDRYKIASGDNNFYPLIHSVIRARKPVIISTGASDCEQVSRVVDFVRNHVPESGGLQLALLHCVSCYPVPPAEINLRAIPFLRERFRIPIGYSDHSLGTDAAVLAVATGARIVEKHFTLRKDFSDFRDHQLSADPAEMSELVRRVRSAEMMLGALKKNVQPCEENSVALIRRSIAAGAELARGHRIRLSDLTWLRPANGLEPGEEQRLVGKALRRDVHFGEPLVESDVE